MLLVLIAVCHNLIFSSIRQWSMNCRGCIVRQALANADTARLPWQGPLTPHFAAPPKLLHADQFMTDNDTHMHHYFCFMGSSQVDKGNTMRSLPNSRKASNRQNFSQGDESIKRISNRKDKNYFVKKRFHAEVGRLPTLWSQTSGVRRPRQSARIPWKRSS